MLVTLAGYVALRLLDWRFRRNFGVRIHTWQRFDSVFREYTSRRNPNLVLLMMLGWSSAVYAGHFQKGNDAYEAGDYV